ncbi:MAG TPA: YceH family protein [Blastocatellia bacterium]|nr:YceH family protein [Blastocatellia bacterium]
MDAILTQVEVRVIGSLMEKQMTTPEYYPISLNALTNACNQLSNRDPIVSYEERTVARALESLRDKKLVWMVTAAGARVPKYEHRMAETFALDQHQAALLCVLMLRGPQTPGELRGRTGRMCEFKGIEDVESTLQHLIERNRPLVVRLPRQPGTKEFRYAHLLAGELEQPEETSPRVERTAADASAEDARIASLEREIETLRQELTELREQFLSFKSLLE